MFKFTLKEADSNWQVKSNGLTKTVSNESDGGILFRLNIAKEGTYNYIVKEVNDGQSDIVYDKREVRVVVTVYETEEGELKVRDIKQQGDGVFTNKFRRIIIKTGDTTKNCDLCSRTCRCLNSISGISEEEKEKGLLICKDFNSDIRRIAYE